MQKYIAKLVNCVLVDMQAVLSECRWCVQSVPYMSILPQNTLTTQHLQLGKENTIKRRRLLFLSTGMVSRSLKASRQDLSIFNRKTLISSFAHVFVVRVTEDKITLFPTLSLCLPKHTITDSCLDLLRRNNRIRALSVPFTKHPGVHPSLI